eukprot:2233861-Karenia_brevis.AAC.1
MESSDSHMVKGAGVTTNKFLDVMLTASYEGIGFDLYNCNARFAATGCSADIVKNRFAPPLGPTSQVIDRL